VRKPLIRTLLISRYPARPASAMNPSGPRVITRTAVWMAVSSDHQVSMNSICIADALGPV
jgi:hypothetical protein